MMSEVRRIVKNVIFTEKIELGMDRNDCKRGKSKKSEKTFKDEKINK